MNEFSIRLYDPTSDDDITAAVAIRNAEWPDEPTTFDEVRHWHKVHAGKHFKQNYLFEQDGTIFATGMVLEPYWQEDSENQLIVGHSMLPAYAKHDDAVFDFLLEKAAAAGATVILCDMRDDKPEKMAQIKARGFVEVMRYPMSELTVADFDFAPYDGLRGKAAAKGIEIMILSDIMAGDDPNWMRKLYDLECTIAHDVPAPEPFKAPPFEQYEQRKFKKPSFNADGWRIAVDTNGASGSDIGKLIGMSYVEVPPARPHILATGLTGVLRDYRRMGLATALKVEVIRWAAAQGAEAIED